MQEGGKGDGWRGECRREDRCRRSNPERKQKKGGGSEIKSSPPLSLTDKCSSEELLQQHISSFVKTKPVSLDMLEEKVIDKKKINIGLARKRKSFQNLFLVSVKKNIEKLDNNIEGKTSLFVGKFADLADYFGKFGTISDIYEHEGISKITFYDKVSAIRALSYSHKHEIQFYTEDRKSEDHVVKKSKGAREDSCEKALENYEADVDSFLFGTEDVPTNRKTAHCSKRNRQGTQISPHNSGWRRFSNADKFRMTARGFVRDAEEEKRRKAVENCKEMDLQDYNEKCVKKLKLADDNLKEEVAGIKKMVVEKTGEAKHVITAVRMREPTELQKKLMAMAGGQEEDAGYRSELILRSEISEDAEVELVDIAESDEEELENEGHTAITIKTVNNKDCFNKLKTAASRWEKEEILKSMGIVSKPLGKEIDEKVTTLVDLSDSESEAGLYSDGSEMVGEDVVILAANQAD